MLSRRLAHRGILALVLVVLTGCGDGMPAGEDPGGSRLALLSADPVFAALPAGATEIDRERRGARYREPGFTGGGWDGPAVIVRFKTASPPADVYSFYAERAKAAGWRPTATGALGFADRWAKAFPAGAPATLVLTSVRRESDEQVYQLAGGVAPASG